MEAHETSPSLLIPRVWRAQLPRLLFFVATCIISIVLSYRYPSTVVHGEIFPFGPVHLHMGFPLFWLVPAGVLIYCLVFIYDVRYRLDAHGIEARVGRLSLHQRITRVMFEDIRSIETAQSLIGRLLDVGRVEIGTAATGKVEIVIDGIGSPKEIQALIQAERDRRTGGSRKVRTREESEDPGPGSSNAAQAG